MKETFAIKTTLNGEHIEQVFHKQPTQWFDAKTTFPIPHKGCVFGEIILMLRFKDSEGDNYAYFRAQHNHNHSNRWFVQNVTTTNPIRGCIESWDFIPKELERNLYKWKWM